MLSPGHVFGTVFRPNCATRTLHTTVSGVNSKRFVLMLLPRRNETLLIVLYKYPYLLTYLLNVLTYIRLKNDVWQKCFVA